MNNALPAMGQKDKPINYIKIIILTTSLYYETGYVTCT